MARLPGPGNRVLVVGSTGSGKTVGGTWLLSTQSVLPYRKMPVCLMDWKRDKLLNSLGATRWPVTRRPPTRPGLYIVHLTPPRTADVDLFLDRAWEQEDIGFFMDECTDYKGCLSVERLYKQGRSKNIPCISLSQQPVGIPRVMRSEAEFYMMYRLNDLDDRKEMRRYLGDTDVLKRRAKHCSVWYDAEEDEAVELGPVPSPSQLRATIRWSLRQPPLKRAS